MMNAKSAVSIAALLVTLPANATTITAPLEPVSYASARRCCPTRAEMLGRTNRKRCGFRRDRGGAGGATGGRTDDFQVTGSQGAQNGFAAMGGHPGGSTGGGNAGGSVVVAPATVEPIAAVPGPIVGSGLIGIILLVLLTLANYWSKLANIRWRLHHNGKDNGTSINQRRV